MALTRSSAVAELRDIWYQAENREQSATKTVAALRSLIKDWEVLADDTHTTKKSATRSRIIWLWFRWVLLCLGACVGLLTAAAVIVSVVSIFDAGNWPLGLGICIVLASLAGGTIIYFCDKSEHPGRYRL